MNVREQLEGAQSWLFCPADVPRRLDSARASGADAIILDLEDGVAASAKDVARRHAAEFLATPAAAGEPLRAVRVNAGEEMAADLTALSHAHIDALVVPKATATSVAALSPHGPPVLAIVESALGVLDAAAIALTRRVFALMLGGADLGAELGLETRADGLELLGARSALVIASGAAGLRGPIDVVHLAVSDENALLAEAELARTLGFTGKACIHPRQLGPVHRAFTPSPDAVDAARRVLEAYEDAHARGTGVVLVDGAMVDEPVVRAARATVARAAVRHRPAPSGESNIPEQE